MPPRSGVADHIIGRVERARRADPRLTWKAAARELGISESSLYKMRAGTRTGQGSVSQRVIRPPVTHGGKKQAVANAFTVTFRSGDRVASRNLYVEGMRTEADALLMKHDPRFRKAVRKQLETEERNQARFQTGSPPWKRRDRQQLEVTDVQRTVSPSRPSYLLHGVKDW